MEYISYLKSLNQKLHNLLGANDDIILIGEDLLDPYGGAFKVVKGLSGKYPGKVFTTPISEAAIMGIANGMALRGLKPVVEIMFGDFITLAADQIINHLSKFRWMYKNKVKLSLVIRTPMGGRRGYGPTHSQSLEKLFMGIPDLNLIAPSNFHDPGVLLEKSIFCGTPVLFIENKLLYPVNLKVADKGVIGNFEIRISEENFPTVYLSNGEFEESDVLIFCYGGMAPIVEAASDELMIENEIVSEIVIPSFISSFCHLDIKEPIERCENIVIVEESSKFFGWGSELLSYLIENYPASRGKQIIRIGSENVPVPSSRVLENMALPTKKIIVEKISEIL